MLVALAGITSPKSSQPPCSLSHYGALEPATGLFWSFAVSRSQHWPSALAPGKQEAPTGKKASGALAPATGAAAEGSSAGKGVSKP